MKSLFLMLVFSMAAAAQPSGPLDTAVQKTMIDGNIP
jgi:hypothetical protein